MPVLFITDTHISDSNIPVVTDIFDQAIYLANGKKCEYIFHLGDVFDVRKAQSLQVLSTFNSILDKINRFGLKLIVIAGNHDKVLQTVKTSYLDVYAHHPAITIAQAGDTYTVDGYNYGFLPYSEGEELRSSIEAAKEAAVTHPNTWLLAHHNFHAVNPDGPVNGLTEPDLVPFQKVLSGHIHEQNFFAKGKIHFIGASLQHNHGESVTKGFWVRDGNDFEFFQSVFPKFHTYKANIPTDLQSCLKEAIEFLEEEPNARIRIVCTFTDSSLITDSDEELAKKHGISLVLDRERLGYIENKEQLNSITNLSEKYVEFCQQKGYTYDLGFEILKKYEINTSIDDSVLN